MTQWNGIVQLAKDFIKVITPTTGTTNSNDYVEVVDLDTRWLGETVITVANTAAVNELTYKIVIYNDYGSGIGYITKTNTIAVSDSDQIILVRHARIKIYVKPTSAGNHTDYQVDAIGGR